MDTSLYRPRPPYAKLLAGLLLWALAALLSGRELYRGSILLLRGERKSGIVTKDDLTTCVVFVSERYPGVVVHKPRRWTVGWEEYKVGSTVSFRQDPENPTNARIQPFQVGSLFLVSISGSVLALFAVLIGLGVYRRFRRAA